MDYTQLSTEELSKLLVNGDPKAAEEAKRRNAEVRATEEAKAAETTQPQKKGFLDYAKEAFDAAGRSGMGFGGSGMAGTQPQIQNVQNDNKVINEVSEATGLDKSKGLLKNMPAQVDGDNVAKTLKDKGVAVTDEYKDKHEDTFKEDKPETTDLPEPGETAKINKNDTPKVVENKKRYNKSMKSIWDAYEDGDIDKETAGYFTIDALATFAKNMGRSIGNVGAQFSGGTIDDGHDESAWEQRKNAMLDTEITAETEGIDTFRNKFNRLSYNRQSTVNDLLDSVKEDAEKLSDDNPLKIAYLSLAASIANGNIDGTTTLASTGAKTVSELFNIFTGKKNK